jgi:hypothetical protein
MKQLKLEIDLLPKGAWGNNFSTIPTGISMFLVSALNSNFGKVTLSYSIMKELI